MAKFSAGKVTIFAAFFAILLISFVLLVKSLTAPTNVGAHDHDQTCYGDCPTVTFTDSRKVIDQEAHYIYASKVIDKEGYYSCDSGWTLDGDQCKLWHDGDWQYQNATYDSHSHKYICPSGWTLYNTNKCKKQDSGYWQTTDATYHQPTYKCPDGYQTNPGQNNCRKWVDATYKTETFTKTFKYNEGEDRECDRPSAQSLGIPSWAVDDFNKLPQHKDKEEIDCPVHSPTPTPTYNPCDNDNHDGHDHDNHNDYDNHDDNHDKDGCKPSPSPSPSESPEPSASPEATLTPTSNPGLSNAGAPVCNATKPGTPTILSAVQNGTSVTLTWSAVPNATYYSIVYGNQPGYQYGVANVGNVTTYTISSLNLGTVYHFAVNAVNDCMPGDPGTFGGGTGGQVLGASTMAGTGSFEENLYLAIMSIGGTITAFGLKNIKKAFKVVK